MAKLTPEQMVIPKGMAPFEVALAFQLWHERLMNEASAQGTDLEDPDVPMIITADIIGGLGPPWPMLGESPQEYGERVAAALFTLIKEI